ncbi:sulfite exporter TauE/SafE family protein [Sporomusa aerivorans]|uniref:sulfite exporter TauE/SafE family protein n=1 Tax=Sporomusa aerivorans TaxID=204936 RepID=UPI00352A0FDC
MSIILVMFIMGLMLGFVGAGGAGVVIAVLSVVFGIPLHTALGTSLGAMVFTTVSGTYSHYRENNVVVKCGVAVGIFGAVGAFGGAKFAGLLPAGDLKWLTAGMLFVSAILLAIRVYFPEWIYSFAKGVSSPAGAKFWGAAGGVGIVSGIMSGTFGIGGMPFILIGLLTVFNMPVHQAAGTTMLISLPIALFGGIGYLINGHLDFSLLTKVVAGLMTGTYIGAKFTRRLPPVILKTTMVAIPVIGGLLLLFGTVR